MTLHSFALIFAIASSLTAIGAFLGYLRSRIRCLEAEIGKNIAALYSINDIALAQAGINKNLQDELASHHAGLVMHAGQIDALTLATNNDRTHINAHCLQFEQTTHRIECLSHITDSAIEAASAAQRFYERTVARERVPEEDLRALGKAIDRWREMQGRGLN